MLNLLKGYLTDIRDYAYLLEKKQNKGIGKVRYKGKLLVIFYVYYFLVAGSIFYPLRVSHHFPVINEVQNMDLFSKLIAGIIFLILPFEVFHFCMSKYLIKSPIPFDGVDEKTYKQKKRVFWTALLTGVMLVGLLIFTISQIGPLPPK